MDEREWCFVEGIVEILLVEDNPDDVELALHALRRSQIANPVRVVRDGQEALAAVFGAENQGRAIVQRPWMILLDLKLPKVDGLEVLRQIRADPRTRTVPVVVMTSSRDDRDLAECYQLGVNSYIIKPLDFAQFATVAQQLGLYWAVLTQPPLPIGAEAHQ